MSTWEEIVAMAEEIIELRRDVEYAGGVPLAQMVLSMDDPLVRIANALERIVGDTNDGIGFVRVVTGDKM